MIEIKLTFESDDELSQLVEALQTGCHSVAIDEYLNREYAMQVWDRIYRLRDTIIRNTPEQG